MSLVLDSADSTLWAQSQHQSYLVAAYFTESSMSPLVPTWRRSRPPSELVQKNPSR